VSCVGSLTTLFMGLVKVLPSARMPNTTSVFVI